MKVIENEKIIPATQEKIVIDKIFIADDGIEFSGYDAEDKCLKYENRYKVLNTIKDIPCRKVDLLDDCNADAFYVKNNNEFQAVLSYLEYEKRFYYDEREKESRFEEAGWYCFFKIYNRDCGNEYPIRTLTYYKELIDDFLEQFK